MKIGILTQPLSNNYGGLLQAYALQVVLTSMGHKVVFINRRKRLPPFKVVVLRTLSLIKCIFRRYVLKDKSVAISNPFNEYYNTKQQWTYDDSELKDFARNEISLSHVIRSTLGIKIFVKTHLLDCVIVGSDQVWREDYSPKITDYFFGFLPNKSKIKRVVYAASFGHAASPIGEQNLMKCKELAQLIKHVSVREKSGLDLLKKVFGINAKQVLDPTLLIEPNAYRRLIKESDQMKSDLISYILDTSNEKNRIISEVRTTLNTTYRAIDLFPFKGNSDTGRAISISQWLSAFANANVVVTDSFHGCVFSIIFKKTFIVIANKDRGIDRFVSLLESTGLIDRLINSYEEFYEKREVLLSKPNFQIWDQYYAQSRSNSLRFLKEALI